MTRETPLSLPPMRKPAHVVRPLLNGGGPVSSAKMEIASAGHSRSWDARAIPMGMIGHAGFVSRTPTVVIIKSLSGR